MTRVIPQGARTSVIPQGAALSGPAFTAAWPVPQSKSIRIRRIPARMSRIYCVAPS